MFFIIGNMQIFTDQVETNALSSYQCCLCNFVYSIFFVVALALDSSIHV